MSDLKVYNSYSRQKEEFIPVTPGHVGMYVCGPTVSGESHLGHARPYITFDVIYRYLLHLGYKVRYVRNITDAGHFEEEGREAEDKISKKAILEKLEPMELVQKYTNLFHWAMQQFNTIPPTIEPTATGHIVEQIEMIKEIIKAGYAYEVNGSVYFDVKKYAATHEYGKLSGRVIDDLLETTRELEGQEEKRDKADFALWKNAAPEHIMRWQSPWGVGFPGWHIECSAMSMKYLGETFDIHAGGIDLVFPHHENEIAQSEGATGKQFVRYWIHFEHLKVEGETMSKSKGNYYTFRDVAAKGFSPAAIRYFLLSVPYNKQLNFTFDALAGAEKTVNSLRDFRARLSEAKTEPGLNASLHETTENALKEFEEGMDDDFNTSVALAAIHDLSRVVNTALARKQVNEENQRELLAVIDRFDSVLNIFGNEQREMLDSEVQALINERQEARRRRDFARADEIRVELLGRGIVLEDTKDGVRWKRK